MIMGKTIKLSNNSKMLIALATVLVLLAGLFAFVLINNSTVKANAEPDNQAQDNAINEQGSNTTNASAKKSVINLSFHGFCIGWIVFIFAMLEMICVGLYAMLKTKKIKGLISKMKLDGLYDKLYLINIIGLCVSGAIFIFSVIAICTHICPMTIISFVLVLFEVAIFALDYMYFKDIGFKKIRAKAGEESKEQG